MQVKYCYGIYECITNHPINNFPHNLKNMMPECCAICEETSYGNLECQQNASVDFS